MINKIKAEIKNCFRCDGRGCDKCDTYKKCLKWAEQTKDKVIASIQGRMHCNNCKGWTLDEIKEAFEGLEVGE